MPTQFKDFLSLADFKKVVDLYPYKEEEKEDEAAEKARGDVYYKFLEKEFHPVFQRFLTRLRDEGRLAKADGLEGRQISLARLWNLFVDDGIKDEWELGSFLFDISVRLTDQILFSKLYPRKGEELNVENKYQEILDLYDRGTVDFIRTGSRDNYDFVSGQSFYFEIEGWKPSWIDYNFRTRTKTQIGPIDIAPIAEMQVEFKTGELLIADWFRIEEFTEGVTLKNEYAREFNINSVMGKEATCRAHWEQHGFISVNLGNTSPRVYEIDRTLTFGRVNSDWEDQQWNARRKNSKNTGNPVPEGAKELGSVCTDLWAATIIERARLVEIVAQKVGDDEAEARVAAYLDENKHSILKHTVEPGPYYLYWSGNYHKFQDNFASPDLEVPEAIEPTFVLSSRKLDLVSKAESISEFKP